MKEYLKPELDVVVFGTEVITDETGSEGAGYKSATGSEDI